MAGAPEDEDPTAAGYGPALDGDVVDVTTPVARAAVRRAAASQPPPSVGQTQPQAEPTAGRLTSPTASVVADRAVVPATALAVRRAPEPRDARERDAIHAHPT